ncbi:TetR/AcrR family transcriptional regulator [Yinghuangia soli]|uniref:TetR/AcrR family transcriptional regulator C-terminal domain-containing protein n=1 Tax=Yinghuangia soli TaxID=2908204 RepID=A0AA41U475_9ACTN|nr:TetR/AcrR family transcriptional regulator C-terminal domain-containing protein [Yinghuangia soli]MCF2530522.1 TetR/AcrR family transcriptional regulator C-terminal domain-containing protein [Yinghuangia soli]
MPKPVADRGKAAKAAAPVNSDTHGPGGGRRHFLNRTLLVDTAISVIEEDGPEALTFRRLGAELEVAPTAVYRHFPDKDALLRALGDRLLEVALEGFVPGEDWRSTLHAAAVTARRAYLSHPRVATLAVARATTNEATFRFADICLGALRSTGLDTAVAARFYLALVDLTLGSAALEAAFAGQDAAVLAEDDAAWSGKLLEIAAPEYPNLVAAAPHLRGAYRDDHFEALLSLLLDAVSVHLPGSAEY